MKVKFTIGRKIAFGYAIILSIMLITGVVSIIALRKSRTIDSKMAEIYQPTSEKIKEFRALASNTDALTNAWIYQPSESERAKLQKIIDTEAEALQKELDRLSTFWDDEVNAKAYKESWSNFKTMLSASEQVIKILSTTEAYDSAELIEKAIDIYENNVQSQAKVLDQAIGNLFDAQQLASQKITEAKYAAFDRTEWMTIGFTLLSILAGGGFALYTTRQITKPVTELRTTIDQLSVGKLPETKITKTNDEIGDMVAATEALVSGLKSTSAFAEEIGKGNLNASFNALGADDILGNSLLLMRDNLKRSLEQESKRNWTVTGLAKFGELLRDQDQDIEKFGDRVLSFTVKYVQANQGRLYVVNDDIQGEEFLQMISCYAWDKKKFIQQKIAPGEGLTGQCWQEGNVIDMTKVPDNYVKITSGLGTANPTNIFIVPLKVNDIIYGIIELASFKVLEPHEKEFITKLSENLAAAISTVRINNKTKILLEQTQQQAEEMKAQEEEMRQNMEELSATQEEMGRKEKEYLKKIYELEKMHGQLNK